MRSTPLDLSTQLHLSTPLHLLLTAGYSIALFLYVFAIHAPLTHASHSASGSANSMSDNFGEQNANAVIRVAVAANFKSTLISINKLFTHASGLEIKLSSASTGVLAQQILYGAPFDIFFSADATTPINVLSADEKEQSDFFCYAQGRLTLVGGAGTLEDLAQRNLSLAIANPVTAPYGRASLEVLNRPEFTVAKGRKLVRGNNAAQAHQFWSTGSVQLALVPLALAPRDSVAIPNNWHSPLEQYALVMRRNAAVDAYIKWIRSDTVRKLIQQAGYLSCH